MEYHPPTNDRSDDLLAGIGESLKLFGGSTELLQKVLDNIQQAVFWKDRHLNYLGCNQQFAQRAGKSNPSEVIGMTDFDMPWDHDEAKFYRECDSRVMESGVAEIGIIESQVNADGELTWLQTNKVPLHDDYGKVIGILGTFHDITRLKQAEESLQRSNEELELRVEERTRELRFVAHHDGLTGLSNRIHFVQQLNFVLESADPEKIALMFIDVDNFKLYNDSDGHEAGDQLLTQVSAILQSVLGPRDMAGRFGGDEFLLLMRDLQDQEQPAEVCKELQRRFASEIKICDKIKPVTTSIGIVFCDIGDYQNSDDLLNDADLAMYHAKNCGKNNHCFLADQQRQSKDFQVNIQKDVLAGIDDRQFVLHYQPIIDLENQKLAGFEALVRWQHPQRGLVNPDRFIPIAERASVIVQLGRQVVEMVCQQLVCWKREFGALSSDLKIHVNLSPRELLEPNFVKSILETTQSFEVTPSSLCLEITESLLLEDSAKAIGLLRELRSLGFEIYLDDFGAGYSSLNYLDELPVDGLKIDRSFVDRLGTDNHNNAVVRMILALAKTLGVNVIAEGIETEFHIATLMEMECSRVQGYLFARPLRSEQAAEFLLEHCAADSIQISPTSRLSHFTTAASH